MDSLKSIILCKYSFQKEDKAFELLKSVSILYFLILMVVGYLSKIAETLFPSSEINISKFENQSTLFAFLTIGFLTPVLEELVFRRGLILYGNIRASICILLGSGASFIALRFYPLHFSPSKIMMLTSYFIGIIISALTYLTLKGIKFTITIPLSLTKTSIYLSSFLFAILHLTNYSFISHSIVIRIFEIFLFGLLMNYVTIKVGLWAAITLHILNNLIALCFTWLN